MSDKTDLEGIKKQLDSYSCPCTTGEPGECLLPSFVKDCSCWWGEYETCKALHNGKYTIIGGVKCFDVDVEDRDFERIHCHRRNDLQIWAENNRHDRDAPVRPKSLETLIPVTNGRKDLFFYTETGAELKKALGVRRKARYIDPRSGFDYGKWPQLHNGVRVRDPAECVVKGTSLHDIQRELDEAQLSLDQQMKYFTAALEVQSCQPPSFSYLDIFAAEVPSETVCSNVSSDLLQDMSCSRPSAPQQLTFMSENCEMSVVQAMESMFGSAERAKSLVRAGDADFPVSGESGVNVPHPRDYFSQGITGTETLLPRQHGLVKMCDVLSSAGLSSSQKLAYLQAANDFVQGWAASFDHSLIRSGKPTPVRETRSMILNPDMSATQKRSRKRPRDEDSTPKGGNLFRKRCKGLSNGGSRSEVPKQPIFAMPTGQGGGPALRRSARNKADIQVSKTEPAGAASPKAKSNGKLKRQREDDQSEAPAQGTSDRQRRAAAAPAGRNRGDFVSAMESGFDRSIWPERKGLGRYPAYITKKGVKHMDDACKYIDNGRLLGRQCEMNNKLPSPHAANELFIARDGSRCSYCTSKNFGPKQCDSSFAGRSRKDESRGN